MNKINQTILFLLLPALSLQAKFPSILYQDVGDSTGDRMGYACLGLGDQNDDGYDDILYFSSDTMYLKYGGPDLSVSKLKAFKNIAYYWGSPKSAANINGDQYLDYIANYIHLGGPGLFENPPVAGPFYENDNTEPISDLNGDGVCEILNYYPFSPYSFYHLHLSNTTGIDSVPFLVLDSSFGPKSLDRYPTGSVNGDTLADLTLTEGGWVNYVYQTDSTWVWYHGMTSAECDTVIPSRYYPLPDDSSTGYYTRNNYIGDVNGDGFLDLAMNVDIPTPDVILQRYYIIDGRPGLGELDRIIGVLDGFAYDYQADPRCIGDVNGDGYKDLLTGTGGIVGGSTGSVHLWLGGPQMRSYPDYSWYGAYWGSLWGNGTGRDYGCCGDVNGDGLDDILFSSLFDDNYVYNPGWVFVIAGDSTLKNPYVSVNTDDFLPESWRLAAPYPNPFNGSLSIEFSLPRPAYVMLRIFDLRGRHIATLGEGDYPAGTHRISWQPDGRVASGVYFIRMEAPGARRTQKAIYLK